MKRTIHRFPFNKPMRNILRALLIAAALILTAMSVTATELVGSDPLARALSLAGIGAGRLTHTQRGVPAAGVVGLPPPIFDRLRRDPLRAPYHVGLVADLLRDRRDDAHELFLSSAGLLGVHAARGAVGNLAAVEQEALLSVRDPLAWALERLYESAGQSFAGKAPPDTGHWPRPLRLELARLLAAIANAERFRRRAFADFPAGVVPHQLMRQATQTGAVEWDEPDYRILLGWLDRAALLAGMQELVAAVQDFDDFLSSTTLPDLQLNLDTPLGRIVLDTSLRNNLYQIDDPLLIIDVGGNDRYEFTSRNLATRIAVVIDRSGDDHYIALDEASCASAAVMGYGILWDAAGDDRYEGQSMAQSAAFFGASLLWDAAGNDSYIAIGHAQAFAIGGTALLVNRGGDDRYQALTHAQASGGPIGMGLLIDTQGNDTYLLAARPRVRPSAQLPDLNISMGQGTGWGLRGSLIDGRSVAGGLGLLLDLEGDDLYQGTVFAQGTGYFQGVGLLYDAAGDDIHEVTWYGLGAAAHNAVGVLIDVGGKDRYAVSHIMALGAGHDDSLGSFVDGQGNDDYRLGNLGLGAANDNGLGLFLDAGGDDRYALSEADCHGFGSARLSFWGTPREDEPGVGVFLDLGGRDSYESACAHVGEGRTWKSPRRHARLQLPSESGAGLDSEAQAPFAWHALTEAEPAGGGMRVQRLAARRAWRNDPRYPGVR